jgi:Bacterial aa3 type cytochrome c oxidase subunit IV
LDLTNFQGNIMAGNSGDMKAHSETYVSVMGMLKWGALACALVGATVIMLIAT